MPNVSYIREEVSGSMHRWEMISDCLSGQDAIKKAGDRYLPRPNPTDTSPENRARYEQYLMRAVFYNVTGRTHDGLVGQVFEKDPAIDVPASMDMIIADVDGCGVTIKQQSKRALGNVLSYGRCGILVDYPDTAGPTTMQAILDGHVRPTIALYDPRKIINWDTGKIGAKTVLTLVVLEESYTDDSDGFQSTRMKQWRVLRLENDTGVYKVEIWREADGMSSVHQEYYPKDASGVSLREIPFAFIGSVDNDPDIDRPPLYDLAEMNIAHYRNSADHEESSFRVGQPTPYVTGITEEWVNDVMGNHIQLGSWGVIPLPVGGSAGLLQPAANTMPFEAMQHKERQMVALGAKLVEQKTVQRTATEASQEHASESSVLGSCAENVSAAYRQALEWCGLFMGESSEVSFDLNTDFSIGRLSADDIMKVVSVWQSGLIAFEEARFLAVSSGYAYLDDEAAKDAMEAEMERGMGSAAALMSSGKGGSGNDDDDGSD